MDMSKLNNISICLGLILGAGAVVGCTGKFEDFNTNRHAATESQMEQDNLLTGSFFRQLQRAVVIFEDGQYLDSDYQITQNLTADSYSGYLAPTFAGNNGKHTGSYYITQQFNSPMFRFGFEYAMPAWKSLKETAVSLGQNEIAAVADILKVAAMHRVTDYYGPIPYASFGSSLQNRYDSQETVYKTFFSELDAAIDALTEYVQANPGAGIMADYDYVYSGDASKWLKFANSLRLRLAMRVVYADAVLAQTEAEKSLSNPVGVMTEAGDIASLKHSAELVYHHPIWKINSAFNGGETQMSASMDSYLNGYNDPRLPFYFKAASDGKYHGVRNGIHAQDWSKYRNDAGLVSAPAINESSSEIVWMNSSEVYFLRAEGALRGWNMGGTAAELYAKGIEVSFAENGASNAAAYIANKTSVPVAFVDNTGNGNGAAAPSTITIAWDEAASFEVSLERIMTQKWIAMYPNGPEAWAEFRRTAYPKLITVVNNDSEGTVDTNIQIRRIPFSSDERTKNPAGVASGEAVLGGIDNPGTRLWWDAK